MTPVDIPSGDLLETILLSAGGPVEVDEIEAESATIDAVREAGISLIVPLIGQGELLGALFLGRRLSDQPYSGDDRRLLVNLASQVGPAVKVAQLVKEQKIEAKERERIQQELEVAALIQHTLLPRELPDIPGWNIDAFYRPARAVGGDFYDFIELGGKYLGVVIGDVTDKGVPAALVMATCRSMLRAAALAHSSPSEVLSDVNEKLVPEIPPAMFVTCLYAIFDVETGEITFANAGHNLPYVRTETGVLELRATGMPLGLMPGMDYEEKTYQLESGNVVVLTSDGITEAHNPAGEMYGFSRLMGRIARKGRQNRLVGDLVDDLEAWTGSEAEQEDDITLVVVRRVASAVDSAQTLFGEGEQTLERFKLSSVEGNETEAINRVVAAIAPGRLSRARLDRLGTAVGETVMNAMEHGNNFNPELDVDVEVAETTESVVVRISNRGRFDGVTDVVTPDLDAKLAGEQSPRGWGLFLIEKMVDEMRQIDHDGAHTVELVVKKEGT